MKFNGQIMFETLVTTAVYLGVFGVLVATVSIQFAQANDYAEKNRFLMQTEKCAQILDALYANGTGKPAENISNCVPATPRHVRIENQPFTAFTIADPIEQIPSSTETRLLVIPPDHYVP